MRTNGDEGWPYLPAWLVRQIKTRGNRAGLPRRRWSISFRLGAEAQSHRITLLKFF